jgi:hypothetical protein
VNGKGAGGIVALFASIPSGLVSLGVGLVGVGLSRWVFITKENRRLQKKEEWSESLPLTLAAMLITGVIIHDRQLGFSTAAFVGLGVGWAAVLLLDVLGQRIVAIVRAALGAAAAPGFPPAADLSGHDGRLTSEDVNLPAEMVRLLDEIDKGTKTP